MHPTHSSYTEPAIHRTKDTLAWQQRRWWYAALLSVLPAFLAIMTLSLILNKQYFFVDRDPDYAYYIAAYKTALGYAPGYLDHPGVTATKLTALWMRLVHWFAGSGSLLVCGLLNAERYLRATVLLYVTINVVMLWFLGWLVTRRTSFVSLGLAAQCGTFLILPTLMASLVKLNAEIVMHALSLAVAVLTVMTISSRNSTRALVACLYGLVCAAGVLTKLNFLPVAVLPLLILKGAWHRLLYLTIAILTAIVLICATPEAWQKFLSQLMSYATRTGVHGKEGVGLLPANSWFVLTRLVLANLPYYIVLLISLVVLLYHFILRPKHNSQDVARVIVAVALVGAIQTFAVVRTPLSYYLIPAMALLGLLLSMVPMLIHPQRLLHQIERICITSYAILLCYFGSLYAIRTCRSLGNQFLLWSEDGRDASAICSLVPTNQLHVHDISLPTHIGGINFGGASCRRGILHLATNALPNVCFYNVLDGKIWTWDSPADLRLLALFYDEIYFLGYADTGKYVKLGYISPPFSISSITNVGQYGLYRIETNLFCAEPNEWALTKKAISRHRVSDDVKKIVKWIEGWYVNTQIAVYYECTNLLVEIIGDETRWRAARSSLDAFGDYYTAAAAFMDWVKTTDEVTKVESLKQMRKSVNEHTWPFYAYAMANSPSNSAAAYVIMPSDLLTRVFNAESLWSPALMWFDAFYERHKGKEGVIEYWETIANEAPSLRGAAATHMMRAALAMGDEERALAIAQQYLTDIRKAEWTVDRAVSMLRRMQHPTARAVSVSLEKIGKEP